MKNQVVSRIFLSLIGFILVQLLFTIILKFFGYDYFNNLNWLRYDSWHYLAIVEKGYELFPCDAQANPHGENTIWCGNTGWFFGYPLLCKILVYFFGNPIMVMSLVVKIFALFSIYLILTLTAADKLNMENLLFTVLVCFYWSFFYHHAVFPVSATVFFILLSLLAFKTEKKWLIYLSCFLASFFYPTGFLLAGAFAILNIIKNKKDWVKSIKPSLLYMLFGFGGMILFFVILYFQVGDFMGFIKVQAKYGHGFHSPFLLINKSIRVITETENTKDIYPIIQSFLVLLGFVFLTLFYVKKRMFEDTFLKLVFIITTVFLFFPWIIGGGELSLYRAEALLLPSVILLKDLPNKYKISLLLVLLALGVPMCYLYFDNFLI